MSEPVAPVPADTPDEAIVLRLVNRGSRYMLLTDQLHRSHLPAAIIERERELISAACAA